MQRLDDDVYVSWELQEDNLDPNGMRLEFQVKNALIDQWKAVPIGSRCSKGQRRFNPGTKQALSQRLTVRDLAKNESWSPAELAGTVVAAGCSTAQDPSGGPMLPKDIGLPKQAEGPKPVIVPPPPVGIEITMPKAQIEITLPKATMAARWAWPCRRRRRTRARRWWPTRIRRRHRRR